MSQYLFLSSELPPHGVFHAYSQEVDPLAGRSHELVWHMVKYWCGTTQGSVWLSRRPNIQPGIPAYPCR